MEAIYKSLIKNSITMRDGLKAGLLRFKYSRDSGAESDS